MRLLRFLTLITFLAVIIPDPKFGFMVFTMILLNVSGGSFIYFSFASLTILSITYTLISLFLRQTQLTRKLNILSILTYYAFLLQFTNSFIKYLDEESLYPFLVFLFLSILTLAITARQLKAHG